MERHDTFPSTQLLLSNWEVRLLEETLFDRDSNVTPIGS